MNTRKSLTAFVIVALSLFVWSCNESEVLPTNPQQESVVAESLLLNSNSALNRLRGSGIGGPMGALFGNFQNSFRGRTDMSPSQMIMGAASDTTDTNPACYTETWEDDGQGNYTFTLDFGDGCDFYGEFLKGKLVETGTYSETGFTSNSTYTQFGGDDWMIDGTQSYSGTWNESEESGEGEGGEGEEREEWEDRDYFYSASYEYSADLTETYMEYGHDSTSDASKGERLIEVDYVAQGSEEMDQDGYTVKSRSESVELSTGEAFTSNVDVPLFQDYRCEDQNVWVFVSGQESGTYTIDNQTGTYSINYGDGTCDNIVTVTENGISEEIDLGEEWEEWEEECGED